MRSSDLAFSSTGTTAPITVRGTLSNLNEALSSLTYQSFNEFVGTDTLTVSIIDEGNCGSGGVLSATAPISITVYSVNDTPSIVSSGLSHNSFQTFQNSSSTILPPIVINDDEPDKSLSISISVSSGAIELGSSR